MAEQSRTDTAQNDEAAPQLTMEQICHVIYRAAVAHMRLPRLCPNRNCRRHTRCLDADLDRLPRCTVSHSSD